MVPQAPSVRFAKIPQITSTITAPTMAPIKPAPSPARYQPIAWPRKVATNAPTIPNCRLVRNAWMNPPRDQPRQKADYDRPDDTHSALTIHVMELRCPALELINLAQQFCAIVRIVNDITQAGRGSCRRPSVAAYSASEHVGLTEV